MDFTGKRVLVVSPDVPYPPNHGGRVDVWGRIRCLRNLGFRTDLVATAKDRPDEAAVRNIEEHVERFIWCRREVRMLQMLSPLPLQIVSRRGLSKIRLTGRYDLALLESECVWPILDNPTLAADHVLLRSHNDEEVYFRELAASAEPGIRKAYFLVESAKFRRLQRTIAERIRDFAFISADELASFSRAHPESNSFWLPPSSGERNGKYPRISRTALCLGSLFMPNNREGVRWYIENVHPRLSDVPDYELLVAGNSRGGSLDWLAGPARRHPNIRVLDTPDDLNPVYRRASVFVCPMLHGAGVKLKTIEAIQNGLPVVSTSVGNQGTGLVTEKHVLVADDPADFAARARELLLNPVRRREMVLAAQDWIAENYDQQRILGEYLSNLFGAGHEQCSAISEESGIR